MRADPLVIPVAFRVPVLAFVETKFAIVLVSAPMPPDTTVIEPVVRPPDTFRFVE